MTYKRIKLGDLRLQKGRRDPTMKFLSNEEVTQEASDMKEQK